jgi:hypothetical protein
MPLDFIILEYAQAAREEIISRSKQCFVSLLEDDPTRSCLGIAKASSLLELGLENLAQESAWGIA